VSDHRKTGKLRNDTAEEVRLGKPVDVAVNVDNTNDGMGHQEYHEDGSVRLAVCSMVR